MSPALTLPLRRHPPRLRVLSPTSPALGRAAKARGRRARPHRTQRLSRRPISGRAGDGGGLDNLRLRSGGEKAAGCPRQERRAAPPQRNLWAQNGEDEKKRLRRGPAGSQASAAHQTPTPEDALPGAPGRRAAEPRVQPAPPSGEALGGTEAAILVARELRCPRLPSPEVGDAGRR